MSDFNGRVRKVFIDEILPLFQDNERLNCKCVHMADKYWGELQMLRSEVTNIASENAFMLWLNNLGESETQEEKEKRLQDLKDSLQDMVDNLDPSDKLLDSIKPLLEDLRENGRDAGILKDYLLPFGEFTTNTADGVIRVLSALAGTGASVFSALNGLMGREQIKSQGREILARVDNLGKLFDQAITNLGSAMSECCTKMQEGLLNIQRALGNDGVIHSELSNSTIISRLDEIRRLLQ